MDLDIEEFNSIGSRVPLLANLKPHGKVCIIMYVCVYVRMYVCMYVQYHMADLDVIGGVPVSPSPSLQTTPLATPPYYR